VIGRSIYHPDSPPPDLLDPAAPHRATAVDRCRTLSPDADPSQHCWHGRKTYFMAGLLQIVGFFTQQPPQRPRLFTCHL